MIDFSADGFEKYATLLELLSEKLEGAEIGHKAVGCTSCGRLELVTEGVPEEDCCDNPDVIVVTNSAPPVEDGDGNLRFN